MPIVGRAGAGFAFGPAAAAGSGLRIIWGISSSIGDVPLHLADRDDGRLLARVELDDPAGAVVAEPGDDDAVAGLEAGAGLGDPGVVLGLALEVGEALVERLAAPLGLGLRGEGRLAGVLGVLAELLDDLQLGERARPGPARGSGAARATRCSGRFSRRAIWRAFDWPMSPMCSR